MEPCQCFASNVFEIGMKFWLIYHMNRSGGKLAPMGIIKRGHNFGQKVTLEDKTQKVFDSKIFGEKSFQVNHCQQCMTDLADSVKTKHSISKSAHLSQC